MSGTPNQSGSHCAHSGVASGKDPPTITKIKSMVFSAIGLADSTPMLDQVYKQLESRQF